MSTDETPVPRTRAELRAAEAAANLEPAVTELPVTSGADAADESVAAPVAESVAASADVPVGEPVDPREAAIRAAMFEAAAAAEEAARQAAAPSTPRVPPRVARAAGTAARHTASASSASASSPASSTSASSPPASSADASPAVASTAASPASASSPASPAPTPTSAAAPATASAAPATPRNDVPLAGLPVGAATAFDGSPASESAAASAGAPASPASDDAAPRRADKDEHPRPRRFGLTLLAVIGVLVLAGAALGFASLTQGPRITSVQVDASQAIESSGSRVILTANRSLAAIDPSQVTVEPAVPFTLDAAGRGVGIRFTVPLDDATEYTITIAGAQGNGGGPSATLTTSFTTPASTMFLLRRDAEGADTIFLTDLSGEKAVAVYSADRIDDFRATSTQLVVSTEEDDLSKLLVMGLDGSDPRELPLPGPGFIGSIQVSERGGLVGYTFSDEKITEDSGRASVLVTQSLSGADEPKIAEVGGEQTSVLVWQFVPDSAAMLFIDFNGALSLIDHSAGGDVQSLGLAANIQGVSRGTYTAVIERVDGSVVELNLTDGAEQPLAASDPDYGSAISIVPFPGGTLRHVVSLDETGFPAGQAIIRVDDDGAATSLVQVGSSDSILQACASPSGQYAAVAIAPDLVNNAYDQLVLPLPQKIETHLFDLRTGEELVALTGFDASWCATAPNY
ncbi:Ig-like domain-containing protein [Microbacterium sp.]|uniref:Ig-like domain-containing protein n=1 Tax=Microbacterium sp. TaxID=51671 RepID=UPI0039E361F7